MTAGSRHDEVQDVTRDFIFGHLSASEHLVDELKAAGLGLCHANRTEPTVPVPGVPINVACTAGSDVSVAAMQLHFTTDGSIPDESSPALPMHRISVDWNDLAWSYLETWSGTIPAQPPDTLVSYRIAARTTASDLIWADPDSSTGEPGLFAYWLGSAEPPAWTRDAIIYHVFLDRFAPDPGASWNAVEALDEIWGGTLEGLRARIPYLVDLGVNCLWLSPIFPSPTHHGYDPTDYFTIEPRMGTMEGFRRLVTEVHAAGMRIVLDFVPNHCSDQHPLFRRALDDPAAVERDLFYFHPDGGYASYFNVRSMPKLALDRLPARDHIFSAAGFWLDEGVDGYRLDHAMGPSHAFWAAFRGTMLKRVNRDHGANGGSRLLAGKNSNESQQQQHPLTIGEVTAGAAGIATYQGRLDGALDFLLLQQIRAFFAFDLIGADAFGRFLERHLAYFQDRLATFSFLDNHDMNRFLWVTRGDKRRLKIASLLQFVLPSPPILYYGTEVGLSQFRDLEHPDGSRKSEESRTLMLWDHEQDQDLLDFYRHLIRLRQSLPDLPDATVTCLPGSAPGLLVLRIGAIRTVLINRSEDASTWDDVPADAIVAFTTGDDVLIDNATATIPPMSGCLLQHP